MPATESALGPRERNKQERRQRILEAIRALLRQDPDREPTVDRIADLAGLSPATVFNLLGPRERQWEALCEDLTRGLSERYLRTPAGDPRAQARRIVAATTEVFLADPAVARYLVNSWGRGVAMVEENPVPALRAALRRGQERGILRPDLQVETLVGHIATACGGALRLWAAGQISDAALRRRARFAVDVAFAAGATEDQVEELSRPLRREPRRT